MGARYQKKSFRDVALVGSIGLIYLGCALATNRVFPASGACHQQLPGQRRDSAGHDVTVRGFLGKSRPSFMTLDASSQRHASLDHDMIGSIMLRYEVQCCGFAPMS